MKKICLLGFCLILASAAIVLADAEPPCWLLDDSAIRGQMSGPMEMHLMRLCGETWNPIIFNAQVDDLNQALAIPNAPDVQVNNSAGDVPTNATTQSECAVVVNPANGVLAAGWNDSWHYYNGPITSFAGYGYSLDGGLTWTDGGPVNGAPHGQPLGDPNVIIDGDGNFYFTCMIGTALGTSLMVSKSTDGGATYGPAVVAHAGYSDDKVLSAMDATGGPYDGNIYLCWKNFGVADFNLFCTTTNVTGGAPFGSPVKICPGCGMEQSQAPYPVVAPNGDLYVAWQYYNAFPATKSKIEVAISQNGGQTFHKVADASPLFDPSQNTQASNQCGRPALKGGIRYSDFPNMAIDPFGTIHIGYSQHGAGVDEADAMYVKSEDGGATWSTPYKLNDDATTNDQFFTTIVANPNGILLAYWYDRRDAAQNLNFGIYKTRSLDGGDTWTPNEPVSDVTSPPYSGPDTATCYMGDYNKGAADAEMAYIIWSDNRNMVNTRHDADVWFESTPICDNAEAIVVFEPAGGNFGPSLQPVMVTLAFTGDDPACPQPGAIYYTLDGTDPTTDSTEYSGSVEMAASAELRILPFTCCKQALAIQSQEYVLCTNDDPLHCGEECLVCDAAAGESCVEGLCTTATDDDAGDDDAATDDDAAGDDDNKDEDNGCGC